MSINTLLDNPDSQSKPWANLYVDTLTAYKGIVAESISLQDYVTKTARVTFNEDVEVSPNIQMEFYKVGRMVTMWMNTITDGDRVAEGRYMFEAGTIPEGFRPSQNQKSRFTVVVNYKPNGESNYKPHCGYLDMHENGGMQIRLTADGTAQGYFPANSGSGVPDLCVTYLAA